MNLDTFQNKLILILSYVDKLKRENVPINTQRILIQTYANDLEINLTSDMVYEILSFSFTNRPSCQIH
ncbi:hypothetical protein [Paramaledivibacter caminithermalis]|jgi:hypothetical protein|uniref:Uncharacterized protein n=1 Tax=Paramaledivibacter caminithermalis (strain DSM 15212 / CIP 107654 / DViRD3) TaxID=1121301 RepID=A0A1M6PH39_PARC5|nr:hypothetical protein [Paramaledivibacter caminithermalis]SHK07268.1 hypothetical protein SAMN02745912_02156 [Paramaledivibacter caminithermalis DSM 15212]